MQFNFVKLKEEEETILSSFLVYANLCGYKTDYICLFENNMQDKNDAIFVYKENFNLLILFGQDKKIKIQQEHKINDRNIFDFEEMKDAFNQLYEKLT